MKFRIYTDTSVLGGCEDEEFAANCKHLADCYDILARTLESQKQDPGPFRGLAKRLMDLIDRARRR